MRQGAAFARSRNGSRGAARAFFCVVDGYTLRRGLRRWLDKLRRAARIMRTANVGDRFDRLRVGADRPVLVAGPFDLPAAPLADGDEPPVGPAGLGHLDHLLLGLLP